MNEILRQIAELLSEDDHGDLACNLSSEGSKLWCALTALRGPDSGVGHIKQATTAVIRWKIGIPYSNSGGAIVNSDSVGYRDERRKMCLAGTCESHFLEHAKNAFKALGMEWDEVNEL